MNTFLSSSQEALVETYREFAKNNVAPKAKQFEEHRASLKDFFKTLGQSGYCGITVPKEYGGQGGTLLDVALFVETVSNFEPGMGLTLATHTAVIELIKKYGNDTQKARFLPLLAQGELIATIAFAEENAGTDWQAVTTTLAEQSGKVVINGKKTWVVNGEIAGLIVVLAKTGEELSLSIVNTSSDAISAGTIAYDADRARLGLRSCYANDVELNGLTEGSESLLGKGTSAGAMALYAMDVAKVILASACVGLTESALKEAVGHAKTRQQFGVNIGQFQAVQWKVADMSTELEGARLQTYRAAWAHDAQPDEFRRFAAMAKIFAAKVAKVHSGEALQILGTFGISTDSPLERFYRDAKMTEICLGTTEAQKLILVEELGI